MKYSIAWVGDRFRDWGDDRRTWTISVKDENGSEIRKVKWDRSQSDPAPQPGDEIDGSVDPHPRFDDAKIFNPGSSGATSTPTASGSTGAGGDRSRSIERQVAVKTAGVVVSAMVGAGLLKDSAAVYSELAALTDVAENAINRQAPDANTTTETVTGVADDIPF